LTIKSITLDGIKFTGNGEVLTSYDDDYGNRLRLFTEKMTDPAEAGILVTHNDLADLIPPAKINDDQLAQFIDAALSEKSPGLVKAAAEYTADQLGVPAIPTDLKADVLKVITGGKTFTDMPWTECPKSTNGAATTSTGKVEARVLNGVVYLRGDVTLANVLATNDSWLTVRTLPAGFPQPALAVPASINGYVGGTQYTPAGIRVNPDGSLAVISTTVAAKGFSFNSINYPGF
jgi:hypothetical protein